MVFSWKNQSKLIRSDPLNSFSIIRTNRPNQARQTKKKPTATCQYVASSTAVYLDEEEVAPQSIPNSYHNSSLESSSLQFYVTFRTKQLGHGSAAQCTLSIIPLRPSPSLEAFSCDYESLNVLFSPTQKLLETMPRRSSRAVSFLLLQISINVCFSRPLLHNFFFFLLRSTF